MLSWFPPLFPAAANGAAVAAAAAPAAAPPRCCSRLLLSPRHHSPACGQTCHGPSPHSPHASTPCHILLQFLLLYKELYYRHIYSKLQPTLEQRVESWFNYCDIFNLLLSVDTPLSLELPNQWLWDMIDEFIYQFQAFCQFRSRVKSKTEEELALLKEASQASPM